jgi:hypothetical protein
MFMEKSCRKDSIPDLRKQPSMIDELDVRYLSLASCLVAVLVIMLLITSIFIVAGAPNSNFPHGY